MNYTGFLNVYKEKGMTSMQVCARIRRILNVDKAGHAGTLDPMAEGVLPVALGRATKSVAEVGDGTKIYEAGMLLGKVTDTQDITGNVLSSYEGELPKEEEIRDAIMSFMGGYDQLTPMYSARQVDGRRLYDIARSGESVERSSKKVYILDLSVKSINLPHVVFTVKCSKGTYVRTLCNDIGEALGCGACMESLKRTAVGDFLIEDTLSLSDIEMLHEEGRIDSILRVIAPTAVSIGKFDGTHVGHQALLKELRKKAEKHRLRSLVLIIEPDGKTVEEKEERRETLLSMGIDYVIELPLTKELMSMSAGAFLSEILIKKLNMKYLVGGKDISFGYEKTGNAEFLKAHAAEYGFHYKLIDKIKMTGGDSEISSTLLREELTEGNMEAVTEIMGHPYFFKGEVVRGRHLGTDVLGVSTMNLTVPESIETPPYGVYAVKITVKGKEDKQVRNDHTAPKDKNSAVMYGIADLGRKPSVNDGNDPVSLEAHAFTENGEAFDAYGKTVKVELLHFIRPERKFDSLSELREQLTEKDIPECKKYLHIT